MGFHTTVITNGTLLNHEKIESILNTKLDTLQVSLWAGSVQDYIQQYPGTDLVNFEKVVVTLPGKSWWDCYPYGPCNIPMGNLTANSFREIWNSTAYRNYRIHTMAQKGLPHRDWQCGCELCCYVEDNVRVHRMFRWLTPFIQAGKKIKAYDNSFG